MVGAGIEKLGFVVVRNRLHVLGALSGRANIFGVGVGFGHLGSYDVRPARCQVDSIGPVHCRIEFVRRERLAGAAVEQVSKAISIEMREGRNTGATNRTRCEHALVDAVVIPAVMWSHLVSPGGHARVRIASEERHGPFVVARPLRGIPRSRISGTVVEQVELRIVCVPAPRCAAAEFPLFISPCLYAGVRAHGLLRCAVNCLCRVKQDFCVRADTVGSPYLLARVEVVRGDVAANAKFASRDTDEDFILYY